MSLDHKIEQLVFRILVPLGLEKLGRSASRRLGVPRLRQRLFDRKYGPVNRFRAQVRGELLCFATEDADSKRFFFPRYDGGKLHEEPVTLALLDALQPARGFVDVGTALGWYTCLAGKFMPGGFVCGFEMSTNGYRLTRQNLELNNIHHAEVHQAVVLDRSGDTRLVKNAELLPPGAQAVEGCVTVPTLALDDFFKDRIVPIDVVKIDVEGAEMSVLRGMEAIINQHAPALFVEVHPEQLPDFSASVQDVLAFLFEHNYQVLEIDRVYRHSQARPLNLSSHVPRITMLYAVKKNP